jgi:hypothetical protein
MNDTVPIERVLEKVSEIRKQLDEITITFDMEGKVHSSVMGFLILIGAETLLTLAVDSKPYGGG